MLEGNFALLLFLATVVTGVYWLAERFYFLPRRLKAAEALEAQATQRRDDLGKMGITQVDGDVDEAKRRLIMQPWWLDWTAGLFPVIVVVFLLRSFLFEPFKIPSGSMIPTLLVGDLILVNKYTYGVRLPVVHSKVLDVGTPLPLQIGVNRGHVFAAEVGAVDRAAYSAMGDTTNTAARIMGKAPHGVLFAHPTVLERSRTLFATTPAGPFPMKGKTVPVPVKKAKPVEAPPEAPQYGEFVMVHGPAMKRAPAPEAAALPAPPALFQCRTWEGNDYLGETATPEPTCAALQVNGIDGSAALGMGSACEMKYDTCTAIASEQLCDSWYRRLDDAEFKLKYASDDGRREKQSAFDAIDKQIKASNCSTVAPAVPATP